MRKILWVLIAVLGLISLSFADTIDNESIFITNNIWYNFNENYNITNLVTINSQEFNIEGDYIFNITTEEGICNITLINLSTDYFKWNETCSASNDWTYHKIGNFSSKRRLLIDGVYNQNLIPSNDYVTFNYTGGFSTHIFELNNPAIFTVTSNSPSNQTITNDNTPDFNFTVSGSESFYSCELFINGSGYGEIKDEWCYQETATTNTTCGGLDTGSYSSDGTWDYIGNTYDENWTTYGKTPSSDANLYITYKKPLNALNSSLWKVKDYEGTTNLSIPSSCWDYNSTELKLRARSRYHDGNYWYCYNGGWQSLRHYIDAYDHTMIYEEAMWWDLGVENNTPTIITANHSISPDGTYNWYINCTASGVTNQSGVREITIDIIAPNINLNTTVSDENSFVNRNWSYQEAYSDENLNGALLKWNGTNETATISGMRTYLNKTGLSDGNYTYKFWVNDSAGNWNSTDTYWTYVDTIYPKIDFVPPTENNQTIVSNNWTQINITINETNLDNFIFNWNGTNTTYNESQLNGSSPDYWFSINKSSLTEGTYTFYGWINDSIGHSNQTETRTLAIGTLDKNFQIWEEGEWQNADDYYMEFKCRPTEINCEPENQNVEYTQSIYKVTNNGTLGGSYIKMKINETLANVNLKCDDDYTVQGATILNTSYQTIHNTLSVDESIYISCWCDYTNPTVLDYFEVDLNITIW